MSLYMPQTRHARPRRHRKPSSIRPPASVVNLGVATGFFGSIVAAAPASAADAAQTTEMPTVGAIFGDQSEMSDAAGTVDSLRSTAQVLELRSEESRASSNAFSQARAGKATAQKQAEQAAAAAKEAARKKSDAERAAKSLSAPKKKSSSSAPTTSTKLPSTGLSVVADFARSKIGSAYVYGARSANSFDCSSLVQAAYRAAGIAVPRISSAQSSAYPEVTGDLKPGDILYWGSKSGSYHVAIYVGGGKYVGAQNSATGVVMRDVQGSGYSGAVRPR
ncbi:C40 family peptidase [Streptomyces vinaceus]|uniref:C40 family peptidase n=1 Tax=Streptomyces vinaceus TaxID=1960 RepID=UPI0035DA8350